MALLAAGFIVLYALFVALLPLVLYNDPRPPWWLVRPIALFTLFSVPAGVALIGIIRGVRALLAVAGALCLLQAFIAFSGVTLGFVIPAMMLLAAGAAGSAAAEPRPSRTVRIAGVLVVVLVIGAWTSLLGLTATRCYVTLRAADGAVVSTETPATESALNGPTLIIGEGGGCENGELTAGGMALGAAFAAGAIAVAWRAAEAGDRSITSGRNRRSSLTPRLVSTDFATPRNANRRRWPRRAARPWKHPDAPGSASDRSRSRDAA